MRVVISALAASLIVPALGIPDPAAAQTRAGEAVRVQPASVQRGVGASGDLGEGDTIYRQARVATRETGSVDMALDDGSRLTLGPNSDVAIDEYVFDPGSATGAATLSLGVGALRMISGRMPVSGVRISTSVAAVGIRGTDFTLLSVLPGLLQVWLDDGALRIVPNESGVPFDFTAPDYVECTLNACRRASPPVRPVLIPERRGGIFGPRGDEDADDFGFGPAGRGRDGGNGGGDGGDGGGGAGGGQN